MGSPGQMNSWTKWIVSLGIAGVALVLVGLSWLVWAQPETIYPGVTVSGVAVSGLTKEQARIVLTEWLQERRQTAVILHYDDFQREAVLEDLGLQPDVNAAVEAAFGVGRQGGFPQNIMDVLAGLVLGHQLSLSDFVDRQMVSDALCPLAQSIDQEPVDGQLWLDQGSVVTTPPQAGRYLDVAATTNRLLPLVGSEPSASVELAVVENVRPAIDEPQLMAAVERANHLMNTPLVLKFDDRAWTLDPEHLAELLAVEKTDVNGQTILAVNVDGQLLAEKMKDIALDLDQPVVEAKWQFTGTQVEVTRDSQEGRRLDVASAVPLVVQALAEDEREVILPVQRTHPQLTTEEVQGWGIREMVSAATTNYFSGQERMHNIELAAARLDGTVIPKGQRFSLNDALGPVSDATGYQQAYVIVGGETVPGMGGGLCQIATTLFQAVFWGGYRIVERYPHEYHMPRYESEHSGTVYKGLDATVDPGVDFVFENNGPSALILKTSTDGENFHLSLYGTEPDWQVSISDYEIKNERPSPHLSIHQVNADMPPGAEVQVEKATDGFDSYVTRIVTEGGMTLDEYTVASSYRATNDVFLSSPRGSSLLSETETPATATPSTSTGPESDDRPTDRGRY